MNRVRIGVGLSPRAEGRIFSQLSDADPLCNQLWLREKARRTKKFGFGKEMAPEVGLEPTTSRLTAARSTIELLWNSVGRTIYKPPFTASNAFYPQLPALTA